MTTFARREVVSTRVEYGVETETDIGTVLKVMHIAYADWCRRENHDPRATMPDDWCRVSTRNEEIVFAFIVDQRREPEVTP